MGKLDMLLGYALSFGMLAIVQAVLASEVAVHAFGLHVAGPEWFLVMVALADALLGTALGLCTSALARTEFQAVQFLPAFILPQFLLCGLLVPAGALPTVLRWASDCLPLTYAVDAMQHLTRESTLTHRTIFDVGIVLAFGLAAILIGAATLRRQTK